jgi:chromosome segregation ATPase
MSKPEYDPPATKMAALREKCRKYALESGKLKLQKFALSRKVTSLERKVVQLESDLKSGAALMEAEAALEDCKEELNEEIKTREGLEEDLEVKDTELADTKMQLSGAKMEIMALRRELADANLIINTVLSRQSAGQ